MLQVGGFQLCALQVIIALPAVLLLLSLLVLLVVSWVQLAALLFYLAQHVLLEVFVLLQLLFPHLAPLDFIVKLVVALRFYVLPVSTAQLVVLIESFAQLDTIVLLVL